jgi:hypothetical protein
MSLFTIEEMYKRLVHLNTMDKNVQTKWLNVPVSESLLRFAVPPVVSLYEPEFSAT